MSVIITPTVDSVYKFSFEPRFSSYDGVYRLVKLVTYDQYLEDGGNILTDFYKGCDLQEADVTTDLADLRESKIMMLANASAVTDEISLYAPLCFVKEVPDCNVKKYYKFGMISYIGAQEAERYQARFNQKQIFILSMRAVSLPIFCITWRSSKICRKKNILFCLKR